MSNVVYVLRVRVQGGGVVVHVFGHVMRRMRRVFGDLQSIAVTFLEIPRYLIRHVLEFYKIVIFPILKVNNEMVSKC